MYSTGKPSCHAIRRLPAGECRVRIVQCPETHGVAGFAAGAADRGQQESVVQFPLARVDVRLAVEDVEAGRRHLARGPRLLQGLETLMVDRALARSRQEQVGDCGNECVSGNRGRAGPLPGPRGPYR